jgi:thiamine biosynthesis lipoprotein
MMPKQSEVDSIRVFVGLNKTTLTADNEIQKEDPRTSFDFSAIAKGYACDEVGRMLERNGVNNYLVEVGGEIVLNGQNPNGSEWNVSVDSPTERYNEMLTDNRKANEGLVILRMSSGAVATSGNYRNFKMIDGKKVVHTMNPRTGYPEDSDLLSVTIVAKNCMVADAYATACMVMGLNRSKAFLEGNDELGGFLVYASEGDSLKVWNNERFRLMTDE